MKTEAATSTSPTIYATSSLRNRKEKLNRNYQVQTLIKKQEVMKMRSFFRMGVLLTAICLTAAGCGKDDKTPNNFQTRWILLPNIIW